MAGAKASTSACAQHRKGRPRVRPARRPAVRERRHPHRPRGQQDPEGHDRQAQRSPASTRRTCPGWDCHGMPIEVQIEKKHGKNLPTAETQRLCRAYATEQIERQKEDFKRLGVLGDWDHPYLTMDFGNEADEIRALGKLLEKGYVYRGLKPVNWCFDCGSALAEAEVEYEDRKRPGDRRRLSRSPSREQARASLRPASAADEARLCGDLDHDAVDDARQPGAERASRLRLRRWSTRRAGLLILAADLREACLEALRPRRARSSPPARARRSSSIRFRHPFYDRQSPVYLGDYVTLDTGTGIVHSAPAYGIEDFNSCRRYGMKDDEILKPVQGDGTLRRVAAALRRPEDLGGEPADRREAERGRRAAFTTGSSRTATCIAGATRRRSSIARPRNGSPAWTTCPARRRKPTSAARDARCAASRRRSSSRHGARRACTA